MMVRTRSQTNKDERYLSANALSVFSKRSVSIFQEEWQVFKGKGSDFKRFQKGRQVFQEEGRYSRRGWAGIPKGKAGIPMGKAGIPKGKSGIIRERRVFQGECIYSRRRRQVF